MQAVHVHRHVDPDLMDLVGGTMDLGHSKMLKALEVLKYPWINYL